MVSPFRIDTGSSTPPFEQLKSQVIERTRNGKLAPGDKLPTVRGLAEELGLAATTVARAYRELEHDEVIETRGRRGSFVSAVGDPVHKNVQLAAVAYADRVKSLGVDADEALSIVKAALGIRP
ncbi:GntR family transcriptional regulator [Mycetocola manganoxydans]|uniref:GntR family transcriptional regulator n=1 Tax=Mycetocola manganoxydans TaxID=699879 RepID=A0A3L6ZU32_9MICO|nr:GntR family transcriptional regulator [Mycetocola manganoxydans]RLP71407.1 GntR family transcriptional regulator [Mycetocola manganoxydans]GHD46330.1 GntR family transcriptional regulator [Mycetocola manganoxydans]